MKNLNVLAKEIAENLGEEWLCKPFDDESQIPWRSSIVRGDGAGFFLRALFGRREEDKINISGLYPYGFSPDHWPQINVTATRGPQTIAKAIASRLFPKYLPLFFECKRQEAATIAAREEQAEKINKMSSILGTKHNNGVFHVSYGNVYATIATSVSCKAKIEMNIRDMSLEILEKVIGLLKEGGNT